MYVSDNGRKAEDIEQPIAERQSKHIDEMANKA